MVTSASAIMMTGLQFITGNEISRAILLMFIGMVVIQAILLYFVHGKRVK